VIKTVTTYKTRLSQWIRLRDYSKTMYTLTWHRSMQATCWCSAQWWELWTGSKVSSNRGFWWDTSTNIPLETVCHMMHVSFVVVNHMFMMPYQLWRNFKVFVLITEWSMRISIYQSWYWHHCCDPHHSISQQQIEMWQSRASWPWNLFLGELIAWRGCKSMCKEQSPRHVRSQRRLLLPWRRCPIDDAPFNRDASTWF